MSSACGPGWMSGETAFCHPRGKKYHTGPHQISVNATHIPASVPHLPHNIQTHQCLIENLAPVKMIAHHLLRQTLWPWEMKYIVPRLTGPQNRRHYEPS